MKQKRALIAPAVLVGLAAILAPGVALAIDDLPNPRSLSMGDSLRASATGALGPLLNPAGMPIMKQYSIEAMYGFQPQTLGSFLHVSIADSVTSRVSAGLYYTFLHSNPTLTYNGVPVKALREGHESGMSLAMALGDRFSFGITAKYVTINTTLDNPAFDPGNPMAAPPKLILDTTTATATANGFTLDIGLNLRLGDSFTIGLVGGNLIPLNSIESPTQIGLGIAYRIGNAALIATDVVLDFNRFRGPGSFDPMDGHHVQGGYKATVRVGGGVEYLIKGHVPIRIGAKYDSGLPGTFLTAGVGYVSNTFGIDLGYKQKIQGGTESMLVLGLRVFLP